MHLCRDIDKVNESSKSRSHVTSQSDEGLINDRWSPRSDMEFGDDEEVECYIDDEARRTDNQGHVRII